MQNHGLKANNNENEDQNNLEKTVEIESAIDNEEENNN